MTKKEVEQFFKTQFSDELKEWNTTPKDKPAKKQAWNDVVDILKKDGVVSTNTDWNQPSFIKN